MVEADLIAASEIFKGDWEDLYALNDLLVTDMAVCKIASFDILLCNYLVAENQLPTIGIYQNTNV